MTDKIKMCSSDVPITNQLFGDNCLNKLKEMSDINKYLKVPSKQFNSCNVPYSAGTSFNSGGFRPGNLNFRSPAPGVRGGQGFRGGRGQISRRPK